MEAETFDADYAFLLAELPYKIRVRARRDEAWTPFQKATCCLMLAAAGFGSG